MNPAGTGWADATARKNRGIVSARMIAGEFGAAIRVDKWVGFIPIELLRLVEQLICQLVSEQGIGIYVQRNSGYPPR